MKDHWNRVEDLYHAALERAPGLRAAFLAEACGPDLELRREVESLLAESDLTAGFLERPAVEMEAQSLSHASARLIGRSLNHYKVVSLVGVGAMAEVYLAHDTQLDRSVAIKVLHELAGIDSERSSRLHREARLLASLNHPNIAFVYGFEQTNDISALVMELVEGETLSERIARAPLSLDDVLDIARQIARGLEAAHSKNIIHRDLKPANVKLTREGRVKILDFGLAKVIQPSSEASGNNAVSVDGLLIAGTVAYMSPEQSRGKEIDQRTDVWAWGCILYEMLTGTRAFNGSTPTDAIARIAAEDPDWTKVPASTPTAVLSVLRRCLQKDPARRVSSMTEALAELDKEIPQEPDSDIALSFSAARILFILIQVGYLAMYSAALYYVGGLEDALDFIGIDRIEIMQPLVIMTAMAGVAVRLYLLSSVGFAHPDAGRNFRRLFPALLILDGAWAASPLLAARTIGFGTALAGAAGLAYLPFSQRTLIDRLYHSQNLKTTPTPTR